MIPKVLTVAGSDSGGGAGIQADLKTFSAFQVYGMSVITAVTAQNTVCVHGIEPLSPTFIGLQFEAVLSDIGVDAAKTGMLFDAEIIATVSDKFHNSKIKHVVVDPVMIAKGGDRLLQKEAISMLKTGLIPEATLITPNIPEAEELTGIKITSNKKLRDAARAILDFGCEAVLIKGGHLEGDAQDVLYDGDQFLAFTEKRIDSRNTHGTGCTYSAAITANLALGKSLSDAVVSAKTFVTNAIKKSFNLGKGHGPLNHFVDIEVRKK